MMPSPPLRFLAIILCGWVFLRAALLGSAWWAGQQIAVMPPRALMPLGAAPIANLAPPAAPVPPSADTLPEVSGPLELLSPTSFHRMVTEAVVATDEIIVADNLLAAATSVTPALAAPAPLSPPILAVSSHSPRSRRSGSAWLFVREGASAAIVPGSALGGSQAGGRIAYRINGSETQPLSLSFRTYVPLNGLKGAEAAAGLDWKPLRRWPLHLLAERRQTLGDEGRSAMSITAYGGVSNVKAGPFRIDAYGQGGVVGARSRDLFADGAAKISLLAGPLKAGAGIWAAAQPGVSRVDVGPQASIRLPANVTLAADWRFKVAGDATPASGPTLTLSTDF